MTSKEWLKKDSYMNLSIIAIVFFVCIAVLLMSIEIIKDNKTKKKINEIATQIVEDKNWVAYTYTADQTNDKNVYILHFYYEREIGQYIRTYVINIETNEYIMAREE